MISLADTVGMADAEQISELVSRGDGQVRLSRNRRPPAQPSGSGRGRKFSPRMTPAAAASIRLSEDSAAVPSPRTRWSAIFRPRK